MVRHGVIEPVSEPSDWVKSIVAGPTVAQLEVFFSSDYL